MRIRIMLHSTTGNTRLVARYAAGWLKARGHTVKTHDIVGRPEPPPLDDTDHAISAIATPAGKGIYPGPGPSMRSVFHPPG